MYRQICIYVLLTIITVTRAKQWEHKNKGKALVRAYFEDQLVDHFDPENKSKWMQRVFINSNLVKKESGAPIFILINGPWNNRDLTGYLENGLIHDIAKEVNGAILIIDFRFYGDFLPTDDLSLENLKYLTIEQGLEDLAHFIVSSNADLKIEEPKTILVGNHWGASIAVWFKQKYPNLCNGVWASNAILETKFETSEYSKFFGNKIKQVNDSCYVAVRNAYDEIDDFFENNYFKLNTMFKICSIPSKEQQTLEYFYYVITEMLISFMSQTTQEGLKYFCTEMLQPDNTKIENLSKFLVSTNDNKCIDVNRKQLINNLKETNTDNSLQRQMLWQKCTELGGFISLPFDDDIFGNRFDVNKIASMCQEVFDFDVYSLATRIKETNSKFGGKLPNITNVYFTYGELVPWSIYGVDHQLNKQYTVDIIEGHGSFWEYVSIANDDPVALLDVKKRVRGQILNWISDDNQTKKHFCTEL